MESVLKVLGLRSWRFAGWFCGVGSSEIEKAAFGVVLFLFFDIWRDIP